VQIYVEEEDEGGGGGDGEDKDEESLVTVMQTQLHCVSKTSLCL